nr:hypothetical protein [Chroogloeocystis siderophila]
MSWKFNNSTHAISATFSAAKPIRPKAPNPVRLCAYSAVRKIPAPVAIPFSRDDFLVALRRA